MIENKIIDVITKYKNGLISPAHLRERIDDVLSHDSESDDNLPPTPEGAVVLPKCFEKPEGMKHIAGWGHHPVHCKGRWKYGYHWGGLDEWRYAVPADSEIARINGVGVEKEDAARPISWVVTVKIE